MHSEHADVEIDHRSHATRAKGKGKEKKGVERKEGDVQSWLRKLG